MMKPVSASESNRAGEAGVTLIELLAALVVVALAFAVFGTGFRLLAKSGDRGTELIARHDMLSRGIDAMRHDVERLERVSWKRGRNNEFVFSGDSKGFTFVGVEPPFPTHAAPFFIIYAIDQRKDWSTLVRSRAPFDIGTKDLQRVRGEDDVTVLEGPFRLQFAYFERKEGRERWVARWSERDRLPEMIRLEIKGAGAPAPIVFRPRVDTEVSCIKQAGATCTLASKGVLQTVPAAAGERK
jgi:prepilin-type N-terminal cleavage/methylation domain-containing protein